MSPTPEARAASPNPMPRDDRENYLEFLADMKQAGIIPRDATLLNVHQIFDENWEYWGSWFTMATEGKPTAMHWMFFDEDWGNIATSENTPVPVYMRVNSISGLTKLCYRAYGNWGAQMGLLSAGTIDISRYI